MARRKHTDPGEEVLITVPTSVMTRVRLVLMDPFTQKLQYGALGELTTRLYKQWLEDIAQSQQATAQNGATDTENPA